ncbi:uncharacterized protein LOC135394511 [Ornithodoros turicata]|uniref:uncharacterized protein LOC135394511 n=1 Tax=Ornithodoros turicata TaxID=34597 RepID=UPI00313A0184
MAAPSCVCLLRCSSPFLITSANVLSISVRFRHVKTRNPIKKLKPIAVIDRVRKRDNPLNIAPLPPLEDAEREAFDEEEQDAVLDRADEYYDYHQSELRKERSMRAKHNTLRKYFPKPPETNLLTWAAKQQIHYLHGLDPQEWDAKRIAECFPISEAGAKKLLKTEFTVASSERIKRHDLAVIRSWKTLQGGNPNECISPVTCQLYREGKLKSDFVYGNPSLPMPEDESGCKDVQPLAHQIKPGEYTKIIAKYLDIKKGTTRTVLADEDDKENESTSPAHDEHHDDPIAATRYTHIKNSPHVTFEKFKRDITARKKDDADSAWERWMEEKKTAKPLTVEAEPTSLDGGTEYSGQRVSTISKYKNEGINVVYEAAKGKAPYHFDEKTGYQYPYGKENVPKQYIRVPERAKEEGKVYKVGNCYYDADGELLYKVPL